MEEKNMEKTVFISHRHDNATLSALMRELLVKSIQGLDYEDILCTSRPSGGLRFGDLIDTALLDNVRDCRVFIALLTPGYLGSDYCIAEFYSRLGTGKDPYLFFTANINPNKLGAFFRGRNMISTSDKDRVDEFLRQICLENYDLGWIKRSSNNYKAEIKKFCKYTDQSIDVQVIRNKLIPEVEKIPYLNAYGLVNKLRNDGIFQNFNCKRGDDNVEPIQFLWADSRPKKHRNIISTQLCETEGNCFLRVYFENYGLAGCNLAVRPQDERAHKASKFQYLVIDAKVAPSSKLSSIGIGLRLVNGYMQHWRLGHGQDQSKFFEISNAQFGEAPLKINIENAKWNVFKPDGTASRGPAADEPPDFSIVASVVIELGAFDEDQEKALPPGKGILDINEIRFEK
jgi:hypothetical protein